MQFRGIIYTWKQNSNNSLLPIHCDGEISVLNGEKKYHIETDMLNFRKLVSTILVTAYDTI